MALESMRDLLALELQDIYGAEAQVLKALPNMVKAAAAPGLKQAFERHLVETRGQIVRLEQCFAALALPAHGKECKGMEGLIGAAQRVEHYEIAACGSAIVFAELLGEAQVATLLRQNLDEAASADRTLIGMSPFTLCREELPEQNATLLFHHSPQHLRAMIQPRMPQKIAHRPRHARLWIPGAKDHPAHLGQDDRAGALGARLERDVEGRLRQTIGPE